MSGLQGLRFATTAAPHANGGRQLEWVGVPGNTGETGGAEAPSSELPKTGSKNDEAAGSAEKLRLSSQCLHETPISAISFFDVDLRGSIAAEISVGQAAWIGCLIFVLLTKARPLKSHI